MTKTQATRKRSSMASLSLAVATSVPLVLGLGIAPASAAAPAPASVPAAAPAAASTAIHVNAAKSKQVGKTTANLHLRQKATTSSKVLGVMKKGTTVTLTGKSSGRWRQVKHGSKTGWASSSYMKIKTVSSSSTSKTKKTGTTTNNLHYRSSVGGRSLGVIPKGTTVPLTGKTSRGWYQLTYKGKTGWSSGSYLKVKNVKTSTAPAKKKAKVKTTYRAKYAGLTYAIIDGGVNWNKPVKKITFLDGDYWTNGYAQSISEWPMGGKGTAMAKVAAKRNMVLVIPQIPSYKKGYGYTWWADSAKNAPKLKKLDAHTNKMIGASKANSWYMGYSGGAEYISFELAKRGQSSYSNGGAILLAGGGAPNSISKPSSTFKKNFDMHWVVGSKDGAGQSSNAQDWSAYKASAKGEKFYKKNGFKTDRTVLKGQDHHSYNMASVMDLGLKKGGL